MSLQSYFEKYPIAEHDLKFLGIVDGVAHITLRPSGLDEIESVFVLPNVAKIDCKLFNAGICKGSR